MRHQVLLVATLAGVIASACLATHRVQLRRGKRQGTAPRAAKTSASITDAPLLSDLHLPGRLQVDGTLTSDSLPG